MPMKRSLYPKNWEEISKRIRFERAGNRCEWCDAPNRTAIGRKKSNKAEWIVWSDDLNDEWYKLEVVLTVAHLDHNPPNCSEENLVALCQLCHLRYDAKEKAQKKRSRENAKNEQHKKK